MSYTQEQLQQQELAVIRRELYREEVTKNLEVCPECHQQTLEKEYTAVGMVSCLSLWWMCGLGILLCRFLRTDFCQECYTEHFLIKAHERRITQVFVSDLSIVKISMPDDNCAKNN